MTNEAAYREYTPPTALREDIECFWEACSSSSIDEPQRVLPDGCVDIIFDLTAGTAQVVGTMTRAILAPRDGSRLFAVRFRAGAAVQFLAMPIHEITDVAVPLQEIWPQGGQLAELFSAEQGQGTAALVADFADALLQRKDAVSQAAHTDSHFLTCSIVRSLASQFTDVSVYDLSKRFAVSRQHLTRQFKHAVGISPKQFQRVARLRRLVDLAWQMPGKDSAKHRWAELALHCGYYDQSHMIADFKDLCGITPAAYFD